MDRQTILKMQSARKREAGLTPQDADPVKRGEVCYAFVETIILSGGIHCRDYAGNGLHGETRRSI